MRAWNAAERTPVLGVDDGAHALRLAHNALAAAGNAPAVTAEPGNISYLAEAKRPAHTVLDLAVPGVDGIELMRTLPVLQDLPVIFILAYGGGDTVACAPEPGAADYVVKPYSPAESAARVPLALRRRTALERFRIGELEIHRDRVPAAERALARRGRRELLRGPTAPGLGAGQRRCAGRQERRHQAPPQARRRRQEPPVHPRRARHGIPHAGAGQPVRPITGHRSRPTRQPRTSSPAATRDLVPRATTCPRFVRSAVRCGEGTRNPAECLVLRLVPPANTGSGFQFPLHYPMSGARASRASPIWRVRQSTAASTSRLRQASSSW